MNHLQSCLKGYHIKLSKEENARFRHELLEDNYRKLFLFSFASFFIDLIIHIVTQFTGTFVFDYSRITLYFLYANLPLLPFISLINRKFFNGEACKKQCRQFAYFVLYAYVSVFLCWGIGLTIRAQGTVDGIHIYILFLVAVLIFLNFNVIERTLIVCGSYLLFVAMLIYFFDDRDKLILTSVYILFCIFVAWLYSFTKYMTYRKNFKDKEEITKLVQLDSMTRLLNHEAILNRLKTAIDIAAAESSPLSVIMIDIDNFKNINDDKGHTAGDAVIKEMAKAILSVTSKNDIVGRYGGDEFMIILPDSAVARAKAVAEAVMLSAQKCTVPVTLSMGISEYMGEELNEFVKHIDKKLYQAKAEGKNRFVFM